MERPKNQKSYLLRTILLTRYPLGSVMDSFSASEDIKTCSIGNNRKKKAGENDVNKTFYSIKSKIQSIMIMRH